LASWVAFLNESFAQGDAMTGTALSRRPAQELGPLARMDSRCGGEIYNVVVRFAMLEQSLTSFLAPQSDFFEDKRKVFLP
jgi:hypothetical protein